MSNYTKKSYIKMMKWRDRNPEKRIAHQAVFVAVRSGRMVKKPCQICGANKVEAHHRDYSKPLAVVWLCKKHHAEADKKLRLLIHK